MVPGYRLPPDSSAEKGYFMHIQQDEEQDWEISADGLYIATRGYLIRRGYCCANKCRNCPYINWRDRPDWQPAPAETIRRTRVSARAIAGAQSMLRYHEQQQYSAPHKFQERHRQMIEHYRLLLERWNADR